MADDENAVRIETALRSGGVTNEISCAHALALAQQLDIPALEVGKTLNKLNIKIRRCQLGCFGWKA